jgi:hypothetical protein
LETFRNPADGKLELKMYWPDRSNVWRQKSNPAVAGPVSGYAPVTVRYPNPTFGGLQYYNVGTTTVIRGDETGAEFFYSVGYMGEQWGTSLIPAATAVSANVGALQAELYVKVSA